ncbi:MAG: 6-bladed beta-propeller [Acidobacteriota bacterium]|nr:6-bladed beta-propeller [Acidobacteriota bacterium]
MFVLLVTLLAVDAKLDLKPVLTLEDVSESTDLYVQSVADVALTPEGDIYLIDARSVMVMVWKADGSFKNHFGKQGQGPGEFSFRGNAGTAGSIGITEKRIYVYDHGSKFINIFDRDHKFIKNLPLEVTQGAVNLFEVMDDENLLVTNASWFSDVPYRKFARYNMDGKLIKEYQQVKDETWRYGSEGGNRRVILIPYATTMVSAYDEVSGHVIVGDNAKAKFNVYDPDGKLVRTVSVGMIREEITKDDEDEWNAQTWFKNQSFFKVVFPDRKPFYNRIVPLEDGGFLVYVQSTYYSDCQGIVIDKNGKTAGRFTYRLGEGGNLFGSRGKVLGVISDEDGELSLHIMKPNRS